MFTKPLEKEEFLNQLESIIAQNKMLNHPFYRTWNEGNLSKLALQEYAKQYYHFVQEFPTYISATHANTPYLSVRQELLNNLIEEEKGEANHPTLWLQFMSALGITEEEAQATNLFPETQECLSTLRALARSQDFTGGVAALYAYESQIPEVAATKIKGLKEYYNISSPQALAFFTVHQEADVYHSASEKNIVANYAKTAEQQSLCLQSAEKAAQAILRLLDGVYIRFVEPALC
ncbi:MAG: CADD family putative folate metabolism protein [Bacteroidia bacterium]|nr:CADD family putative folate metabolism protein [Bacteroidia bacterium]MDW8158671.1 CADD family putative folate metabolism protein [Bacteroidia bacterium]